MTKSEIIRYEMALFIVQLPAVYQRYWMALFNEMFTLARRPLLEQPRAEILEFRRTG